MRATPPKETLPDERFTKQQLNVLFSPIPRWQGLEEHHRFLKVHFDELVGPFDEEGGADVKMKV
jgi:hypothetical protein